MAKFELLMPKMGESVQEATITKWFKNEGDSVEEDDVLLEIATDKVDSEIPSPVDGVIQKILFKEDDIVAVGEIIAIINTDGDAADEPAAKDDDPKPETAEKEILKEESESKKSTESDKQDLTQSSKFLSPLVKSIAKEEGITVEEIEKINGTGRDGRIKKEDILKYIEERGEEATDKKTVAAKESPSSTPQKPKVSVSIGAEDTIVKMDRMRKIIAENMVNSVHVSPHVTSMVEADVTNLVNWRNKIKDEFQKREGQKLTFTPIFIEAISRALRDFPGVNASVDGENIILRKHVNIGMAVALPDNNLIVPVIRNADQKNLAGLSADVNRLAKNARENKLSMDDIQGGTFTITNFGTFRNVMGTPIINQPQVAILATGSIEKKPAVLETPDGDVIAIRQKMFLSLSYDHRVVDGALGGAFVRKIADYLENFDVTRSV